MNLELSLKIIELHKNDPHGERVEKFLEDSIAKDPTNIDLWLRLAILEIKAPIVDYDRSFACLNEVFKLEAEHPIALLCLAYSYSREFGFVSEELFKRLQAVKTDSAELNSMLNYAMSWFYRKNETNDEEIRLLQISVDCYQGHVWNYIHLARYYSSRDYKKSLMFYKNAFKNIVKVYKEPPFNDVYDHTDVDEYINAYIKGIYIVEDTFNRIKKILEERSS